MYTPSCPSCAGTGTTHYKHVNGGRCYTCHGNRKVTPCDVLREMSRHRAFITLASGRRVSEFLLTLAGEGNAEPLCWSSAPVALLHSDDVLIPSEDGWEWERDRVVAIDGWSEKTVKEFELYYSGTDPFA